MTRCVKTLTAVALTTALLCGCTNREVVKEKIAEKAAALHHTKELAPVPVRVITIRKAALDSEASYVGRVEPAKSSVMLSPLPGTLDELYAVRGRKVQKGAVIAHVRAEAAQAAYDVAKATLTQAEDGYARASQVYGSGAVTEVKMVEVRTKLEQARAAEKSARQTLDDCTMKAPFTAVVGEVYVERGEQVSAAAPVVQLLDLESVEVHFSVPEGEYADLAVGDTIGVEVPALKRSLTGVLAVKGVAASPLSHTYDFTLKNLSDAAGLMPGMVCKVRTHAAGSEQMVIPASAVMTDMEGRYVWAVTADDTVCKTYITVGGYAGQGIVVGEGLAEGDRVIVGGSRKVSTGMKVKANE